MVQFIPHGAISSSGSGFANLFSFRTNSFTCPCYSQFSIVKSGTLSNSFTLLVTNVNSSDNA